MNQQDAAPTADGGSYEAELNKAICKAQEWLLERQHGDGHWVAELEGDTILESEYVLLERFLGRDDPARTRELCRYALEQWQQPDGGVPLYPGGPPDVSASVKLYFACKLAGHSPDEPRMVGLRECILRLGGVTQCNTFTKLYLAIFGQYDWEGVPTIPPEIVILPGWLVVNIYEMSSWSRAILVPLAIINALKPSRPVPQQCCIDELFVGGRHGPQLRLKPDRQAFTWHNLFLAIDRLLKLYDASPVKPGRKYALKKAEQWMLERQERSGGLGAIFPAMTHAVMAYKSLGYSDDHPAVKHELEELAKFEIHDDRGIRMQPCVSPVWDTAISLNALLESGVAPESSSVREAVEWLLSKQTTKRGDWSIKVPRCEPGGWFFEYENEFYPDVDDTVMILMALRKAMRFRDGEERIDRAIERGVKWTQAMQCRNGGWGAFDKDNTRMVLQYVPYADHNAMLDPPTADITARTIEAFSLLGLPMQDPSMRRAVDFIWSLQEQDGSWFGRWGVNYLYGTWQCIQGLCTAGVPKNDPRISRAVSWLVSVQNEDGGWGETCDTYADPSLRGQGASTASQTAWALLGLISGGEAASDACYRGVQYLLRTQTHDGTWDEPWFTGTGFPRVFYLRYHYYRHYFPLWALGRYVRATQAVLN
jgi:squalene-hopene/tetraprenyl-beta-curcumene cyclase